MAKSRASLKPPARLVFLLLALLGVLMVVRFTRAPKAAQKAEAKAERDARAVVELTAREQQIESTVWSAAIDAQRHEDVLLRFWDSVNRATNALAALGTLPFRRLQPASLTNSSELPHGIHQLRLLGSEPEAAAGVASDPGTGEPIGFASWFALLAGWQADGWRVDRTSWRQIAFVPAKGNAPARSVFAIGASVRNDSQVVRLRVRGELEIGWQIAPATNSTPAIDTVQVRRLDCLSRHGQPLFSSWLAEEVAPATGTFSNDPLLIDDLDGDGRPELILVGANRVWWNLPPNAADATGPASRARWQTEPLASLPESQIFAAVLADISGLGRAQLVCAVGGGVLLVRPDDHGRFSNAPEPLWEAPEKLRHAQVLTVGDIDGDGDLDVFLGQYKLPYHGGQMPTPFFNANDGFPSYLLRNDGGTNLTDITAASGLGPRSHRRVYSSSLVDLDADGDLDLVLVCDFSGVDLFLNDGHGHFTDVTAQLGDDRHLAGMAHAVGDFDGDGRVDLLAIGMDSPTAATLDSLKAGRDDFREHTRLRPAITFGNRLFLGDGRGGFRQAPSARALARTGWTWGVTAFDLENDGDTDFYFANGHETYASVRDYERQFWLHDIYVGTSRNDPVTQYYFRSVATSRREVQASFGGWQDNVLLADLGQQALNKAKANPADPTTVEFPDIAYLAGVPVSADSRNVLAADLDGDGREDLVAMTFELWPEQRQRLLVFHNETPGTGHWIGFQILGHPGARSPIGGRLTIDTEAGSQTHWFVTGDGYRTQHPMAAHFGLGRGTQVKRATMVWPDGSRSELGQPRVDRWHPVRP